MAFHRVTSRKRPSTVARIVWDMVRSLTDGTGRFGGVMRRIMFAQYAEFMFSMIGTAYMDKARGGADELGNTWPPLQPSTIAARPITHSDRAQHGLARRTRRGLLTPAEDKLWRRIFRARVVQLVAAGYDELTQAKPRAAAAAWAILKARGAKTRKATLSGRRVLILIDTWRLNQSLRVGSASQRHYYKNSRDQIYDVSGGTLRLGTSVPYAKFHATGTRHMPARPPMPTARQMQGWSTEAAAAGLDEVVQHMMRRL